MKGVDQVNTLVVAAAAIECLFQFIRTIEDGVASAWLQSGSLQD